MKKTNVIIRDRVIIRCLLGALIAIIPFLTLFVFFDADAKVGSSPLLVRQVVVADEGSCALASDHWVYCWGGSADGRLGNGNPLDQPSPAPISRGEIPNDALITQIAAGDAHVCALASNHKAYCWGNGANGRLGNGDTVNQDEPVEVAAGGMPGGVSIRRLAAGAEHTCAIASNNLAYCWGNGANGRLGNGDTVDQDEPVEVMEGDIDGAATFVDLALGGRHTCGITSRGEGFCWGYAGDGQLGNNHDSDADPAEYSEPVAIEEGDMPSGATLRSVSAGAEHTCVLASDNWIYCTGLSANGRLGDGVVSDARYVPIAVDLGDVPSGETFLSVSAGAEHTCAIASNHKAYCWGNGEDGQVGHGESGSGASQILSPVEVALGEIPSGVDALQLGAGSSHTCAIGSDGKAYCWGSAEHGRLGNGQTTAIFDTPVETLDVLRGVSVSQSVYRAYGPSATTSPGSPLAADNTPATLSSIGTDFRIRIGLTNLETDALLAETVSLYEYHTCAIGSDGKAYCWGEGSIGELGVGANTQSSTPLQTSQGQIPEGVFLTEISLGRNHACALGSDHWVYCWGSGANGRLGNNSTSARNTPYAISQGDIPSGVTLLQVTSGYDFSCALGSDYWVYCWGEGQYGRLGNGAETDVLVPKAIVRGEIPNDVTITDIDAGDLFMCSIGSDKKAYCWGDGFRGQLGDGDTDDEFTPVAALNGEIPAGEGLLDITAGSYHTCAVATNHWAYCWGYGAGGRLGNNSSTQRETPVAIVNGQIPSGRSIRQVSGGAEHTCAVASDNQAYCWGAGGNGRLGNGATSNQSTPRSVLQGESPTGSTIKEVRAGRYTTCAVTLEHRLYCWGDGSDGQLGNGSTPDTQSEPVATVQGEMVDESATIVPEMLDLELQVAPLGSAETCEAVTSGWVPVNGTSPINWAIAPPSHGTAIGTFGSDPADPTSFGLVHQSIVQSGGFTNDEPIGPQQTGLWDFVLHDRTLASNADYCLRIDPAALYLSIDEYDVVPQLTTATGVLDIGFVDEHGDPVTGPASDTPFTSVTAKNVAQTATAELLSLETKLLSIHNSMSSGGWNVTIAATDGPSAAWVSDTDSYPYNAATSADGQLSVDLSGASRIAVGADPTGAPCSTTGVTTGNGVISFSDVVSSISLLTGDESSQFNCVWKLSDVLLRQTIPAQQPEGTYHLGLTITIVAN